MNIVIKVNKGAKVKWYQGKLELLVFKFKMWIYKFWFKLGIQFDYFDGLDYSKCGYNCYKKGCNNCSYQQERN